MNIKKNIPLAFASIILLVLLCGCDATRIPIQALNPLNLPDATAFLAGGHPMDGVNYERNNRSQYLLPASLDNFASFDTPIRDSIKETYHSFVLTSDERIYLGGHFNYDIAHAQPYNHHFQGYSLWSFYFGEDSGTEYDGGMETFATSVGAFTLTNKDEYHYPIPRDITSYTSSFLHYIGWPEPVVDVTKTWTVDTKWDAPFLYNGTPMQFTHVLPLPDGRVILSINDGQPPVVPDLWLLDENAVPIDKFRPGAHVTGFAYNGETGVTYVATEGGLKFYDLEFNELWNSFSGGPRFAEEYPVIGDDGAIWGCMDGVLRRLGPGGNPGGQISCGALMRPVVLNDGTIAVITDSSIKYFDDELNETGEIALPTGPDTGESYTRPPLVDADDRMILFNVMDLFIIDMDGNIIAHRSFDNLIREVRLGPEHLFVALDYEIYRFPS